MENKKKKMIQQDLRSAHAYILSVISLVLALFVPLALVIIVIFKASGLVVITFFMPVLTLILGIVGLVKSLKQSASFGRTAKILSIVTIIINIILIAFLLYVFIKSGGLTVA